MQNIIKKYNFNETVYETYAKLQNSTLRIYYTKKENSRHLGIWFENEERARIHKHILYEIIKKSLFEVAYGYAFNAPYVTLSDFRSYLSEDEFETEVEEIFNEFYKKITPTKEV